MAQKLDYGLPQDLDLPASWTIRVTAVDANGALVSGVNVANMAIVAETPDPATADQLAVGPFMLVPGPNA